MKRLVALVAPCLWLACGPEEGPAPEPAPEGPEDVTLEPPARGFQFETPSFEVAVGEEVQDCYFFRIRSDAPIYVNEIQIRQNPGTHHMNFFRVKTQGLRAGDDGDVVRGGPCWDSANWSDWPLIANSQESDDDEDFVWELPPGVAHRFEPGELLMAQTHYVNAGKQSTPGRGKVLANFYEVDASEVEHEVGTIFATNQNLRICPGETEKNFSATCIFARDRPVTVIAANGHFHSRGVYFSIAPYDPLTGEPGEIFYESHVWDDPPMRRDLAVPIGEGGGMYYTCSFTAPEGSCGDPEQECCYTFGPHSPYQEHCNVFLYYYPRVADANCF